MRIMVWSSDVCSSDPLIEAFSVASLPVGYAQILPDISVPIFAQAGGVDGQPPGHAGGAHPALALVPVDGNLTGVLPARPRLRPALAVFAAARECGQGFPFRVPEPRKTEPHLMTEQGHQKGFHFLHEEWVVAHVCRRLRSEERRVGKACVSPCRSRGWPNN